MARLSSISYHTSVLKIEGKMSGKLRRFVNAICFFVAFFERRRGGGGDGNAAIRWGK